jgi:hypothetical protein
MEELACQKTSIMIEIGKKTMINFLFYGRASMNLL